MLTSGFLLLLAAIWWQQKSSVKLWGWDDLSEKVVVTTSWNGKRDSVKVDPNAKWILSIETTAAGGPFSISIKGYNTIVLDNILIGEVWLCRANQIWR